MSYLLGKHPSFTLPLPSAFTYSVYHLKQSATTLGIATMPSKTCSLNIRYAFEIVQFSGWTPPKQHEASPLNSFFLDVKSESIHPAPSRAAALDQANCACIFYGFTSNICPAGNTGRVISDSLVERFRFDGARKARFAVRGRTLKLFIARAIQSLHGSFDFHWGEKSSRIFDWRSPIKKRNSHFCAWAQSFPCATGVAHSSEKPSHLNVLRVAERNFT